MSRQNRNRQKRFGRFGHLRGAERLEPRWALDAALAELLPRFESPEALREYLLDDALDQYSSLFGQPVYDHCWEVCFYPVSAHFERSVAWLSDVSTNTNGGAANVSSTNVQVEGVDEGDIIEADAGHLYVLGGRQLAIVESDPAGGLDIMARVDLPGRGVAEYLYGDRLTVITTESFWGLPQPLMAVASSSGLVQLPFVAPRDSVTVTVFDISDRTAPRITEQTNLDGSYRDSRAIDDKVVVIVNNGNLTLPPPEQICPAESMPPVWPPIASDNSDPLNGSRRLWSEDNFWGGSDRAACIYETRDVWLARMDSKIDGLIAEQLPHFTSYDSDHNLARAGLLHEAGDLVRPVSEHPSQILSVVTFDVNDDDAGVLAAEGIVTGWAGQIYASRDSIIVTEPIWNVDFLGESSTRLLLYRWDAATGSPYAASVGDVPGTLLSSFSLDEYQGSVRVATTTTQPSSEGDPWETSNHLFVLETVGATMEIVGQLNDFGVDERIHGVRFLGDTAFVVTFRQIDPLFTVDLSNPSQPTLLGELEMPGFSGYLQMLDDTHLLGLGYGPNAKDEWVPRLALFDVANLAQPKLLDEFFLPVRSSSVATWDHHALQWNATDKILTLPVEWSEQGEPSTTEDGTSWPTYRHVSALFAWHVDTEPSSELAPQFRLLGEIHHETGVQRSVTIGDHLYSLSYADLKVVGLGAIDSVLASVDLFTWPEPIPPWLGWEIEAGFGGFRAWDATSEEQASPEITPTPWDDQGLDEVLASAKEDLAARLGVAIGQVRLISVEPARPPGDGQGEGPSTGFQVVLGVGARHYLYEGSSGAEATLSNDMFAFIKRPDVSPWHNVRDPLDSSGDGVVAPQDALVIINELNLSGARELQVQVPLRAIAMPKVALDVAWFWDVDGDHFIAPMDALRVINWLNAAQAVVGEGEDEAWLAPAADLPANVRSKSSAPAEFQASSSGSGTSAWAMAVDAVVQETSSDDPLECVLQGPA